MVFVVPPFHSVWPPTGTSDSTAHLQGGSPLFLLHTPPSQTHGTPEGGFPSLPVTALSIQVDGQIITDGFGLWVPQGKGAREVQ